MRKWTPWLAAACLGWLALPLYAQATRSTDHLTLPPFLESRVAYFHSFQRAEADIDTLGSQPSKAPDLVADGFAGGCLRIGSKQSFSLGTVKLALDRPLTIGFWWSLPDGVEPGAGGGFFSLGGDDRRYISHFIRGGPWCGLKDSANVLQVYNFPGITDHNDIFDRNVRPSLTPGRGRWHHTLLTVSNASEIKLYIDGKLATQHVVQGRAFQAADALRRLTFGSFPGASGLYLDELMILDAALGADEAAFYWQAVSGLRQTGLLRPAAERPAK